MGITCSTPSRVFPEAPCHECPICMDHIDIDSMVTTNCGHHFHDTCITECLEHKHTCPMCRTDVYQLQTPRTLLANTKAKAAHTLRLAALERKAIAEARKDLAKERRRRRMREKAAAAMRDRAEVHQTIAAMRLEGFRHDDHRVKRRRRRQRRSE